MATRARFRGVALLTFFVPLMLAGLRSLPADEEPKSAPEEPKARGKAGPSESGEKSADAEDAPGPGGRVVRTDAEWRRRLTTSQYMVTRQKATEPAWSGKYAQGHFKGTFACVCCGAELFSASHKFPSGTGWPSFWRPVRAEAVTTADDFSAAEPRTEVMCSRCDAHLGHVFSDGPAPTGLRFCINSVALKLQPATSSAPAKAGAKAKGKGKAKPKSKPKPKADEEPNADAPAGDEPGDGSAGGQGPSGAPAGDG